MKKILIGMVSLIPSLLFSYELEFNKTFKKNIQSDKLDTKITVMVNSREIDFINEKIEFFQDFIKENKSMTKKNGSYSLLPNYSYQNNKQKLIGYRGNISYNIQTKEYENLNQFIFELNNIRKNMNTNKVKLSVSNISWVISDELYEKNIDSMRIDAIKWIKKYKTTLNDNCVVKNISINKNPSYSPQRFAKGMMLESSSSSNISPSQTKQSITINTNYKLECN